MTAVCYRSIRPVESADNSLQNGSFVIPGEYFGYTNEAGDTVEQQVSVRFAEITEGTNLSAWTDWYQLARDGTLTEFSEDALADGT
jgi:hypothetical protein